jgi:hypothetical protein
MGGSSRPEIEAPENKITICRTCHSEITEHRWHLARNATELTITHVATGAVLMRRRYQAGFDAAAFFGQLNHLESGLEGLLTGIPYLTDEQLVELFQQLRGRQTHLEGAGRDPLGGQAALHLRRPRLGGHGPQLRHRLAPGLQPGARLANLLQGRQWRILQSIAKLLPARGHLVHRRQRDHSPHFC